MSNSNVSVSQRMIERLEQTGRILRLSWWRRISTLLNTGLANGTSIVYRIRAINNFHTRRKSILDTRLRLLRNPFAVRERFGPARPSAGFTTVLLLYAADPTPVALRGLSRCTPQLASTMTLRPSWVRSRQSKTVILSSVSSTAVRIDTTFQ
jgi:hypothetical protein